MNKSLIHRINSYLIEIDKIANHFLALETEYNKLVSQIKNERTTLDSKFQHQMKMLELTQKLSEGLFLKDILEYVYTSFQTSE